MRYYFKEQNHLRVLKEGSSTDESSMLFMFAGATLFILGALALSMPMMFSFGVSYLLGAVLIASGCLQMFQSWQERREAGVWSKLVSGVVSALVGIAMMAQPLIGLFSVTLLLICYLVVQGFFKISFAVGMRHTGGWVWVAFSGIVSVVLGFVLLSQFPVSALYVIGIFLGIDLMISGLSQLILAFVLGQERRDRQKILPKAGSRPAA